jgi:tetratricopeptide (TPR) repeat protein
MKKAFLLIATLIYFTGAQVMSQTASVINYSSLERKLGNSDDDIQSDRRNTRVSTWVDRADLFVDIFNVHNDVLYIGMSTAESKLMMQNPNEIQTSQDGPNKIEDYVYDRVTLRFVNDQLESWTETQPLVDNPLEKAKEAIDKAIELNDGGDDEDIQEAIAKLQGAYEIKAVLAYDNQDFEASYNSFSEVLALNELPVMGGIEADTVILYNTGRTALESGKYPEAVELFTKLDQMDYSEPFIYIYLEQSLMATGDTAQAVEMIRKGFNKYPENQPIMNEMINYYINTSQADQALQLLNTAKQRDPENISYVFAEAVMYEMTENFDEAERVYLECLDMDPEYFNAAYNLGVLYYNEAVKIYEQASMTTDNNEFQELDAQGDETLKKAIPYMERASEIDPTDTYVLENLRNIYYRLDMTDNYNDIVNKLQNL